MTPEYLNELADLADPDNLWRLSGLAQMALRSAASLTQASHCGGTLRTFNACADCLAPGKACYSRRCH